MSGAVSQGAQAQQRHRHSSDRHSSDRHSSDTDTAALSWLSPTCSKVWGGLGLPRVAPRSQTGGSRRSEFICGSIACSAAPPCRGKRSSVSPGVRGRRESSPLRARLPGTSSAPFSCPTCTGAHPRAALPAALTTALPGGCRLPRRAPGAAGAGGTSPALSTPCPSRDTAQRKEHRLPASLENDPRVTRAWVSNSSARLLHTGANTLQVQRVYSRHVSLNSRQRELEIQHWD